VEEVPPVDPLAEEGVELEPLEAPEPEPLFAGDPEDREVRAAVGVLYGAQFPFLHGEDEDPDAAWPSWAKDLWASLAGGVRRRLHDVERNRRFLAGDQWISPLGIGVWREPPRPTNAARLVFDLCSPARDMLVNILSEQRPGFRCRPATQDPDDFKQAEARQGFLEYQFDQQERSKVIKEIGYWVVPDGACFEELYWDVDRGPWDGDLDGPLGDPCSKIRRIEQVRVSPNATATQKPFFWVLRDLIPLVQAVAEYGEGVVDSDEASQEADAAFGVGASVNGLGGFEVDELHTEQRLVERFTVYCERGRYLPQGLHVVTVGQKVVSVQGLPAGVVPMIRWTDGSTDPAFFCEPKMNQWVPHQVRLNALWSKLIENIRFNAGPKLLGKVNAVKPETLVGGTMSLVEVTGLGSLSESVQVVQGMSVSKDVMDAFEREMKALQDLTGRNDTTMGSFSSDQSGRAILAIREQVERTFAPLVLASCEAQTAWAKITVAFGKEYYDLPRMIGVQGESRVDLARQIHKDDLDGAVDVWIDPETLMPMPRSLRLFLLKDLLQVGGMSVEEYRRRSVFGWVRSLGSPDEDQEARARRVAESIRQGRPLPMKWWDDEAIHQDVLLRELILPDNVEPQVAQLADQRMRELANQAGVKSGMLSGQGAPSGAPTPQSGAPQGLEMLPTEQPFQGSNPPIAASTGTQFGEMTDQAAAGAMFDSTQPL